MVKKMIGCLEALNQFVPGYSGGYFYLLIENAATPVFAYSVPTAMVRIGRFEVGGEAECLSEAKENAFRLARNSSHRSSWQSQDEAACKPGGAVRFKLGAFDWVMSFSGYQYQEHWNEALMLAVAKVTGIVSADDAYVIANEATRPCLDRLMPRG